MRSFLTTIFIAIFLIQAAAEPVEVLRDSLRQSLRNAKTPNDSLRIYLDLFDTAPHKEYEELANAIYPLAVHTHNITVQLEMLRRLANITQYHADYDSLLNVYSEVANALPSDEMQRSTLLFIEMMRTTDKSKMLSDSARTEFFHDEILDYAGDEKSDLTEQIRHHYAVCLFLGGQRRSPLLASNVNRLGQLIQKLPYQMEAVRNLFYTQAARMYTIIGDRQRAVTADREMLRGIRAMQQRYRDEGRQYRSYNTSIYNIYRRMLINYDALAPTEADTIYSRIREMSRVNAEIASDMGSGIIDGFYAMSKGDYAAAIPRLRHVIEGGYMAHYRPIFLSALVEAAEKVGDKATLLYAMPLYIQTLEELTSRDNLTEIINREVDYKVSDFQRRQNELNSEITQRTSRDHTYIVIGSVLVTIVLLTCLVLLWRLYSRARRLSRTLAQTNATLTSERDKLKRSERDLIKARDRANKASSLKTDFINNMSREVSAPLDAIVEYSRFIVDNMDVGRRKYMQKFADVVILSAELLHTLINDVLDTSSIERGEVEINRRPIALAGICNMAIGNFRNRMNPGVELEFVNEDDVESIVTTDPQRVEQVIMNMLSNAAKFTTEGRVTLSYEFDIDRSHVTFAVTDTGIGIPKGKEEIIFGRFEKLDSHTQGSGLGLYICSLIARLLGGSIRVDTDYKQGGARFLFTIPTA